VCCVVAVPVPVMLCMVGEFAALLTNVNDAEVAPLACGVKVTVKLADCPAVSVAGNEIPESTNSLLLRLAEVIVTDAPLAIRLPPSAELDPTATLPKLRLVGDTANCPADVPVPERAIFSGEFDAFETTAKVPLAAPAPVGAKVAVKVTLCPPLSVIGKLNPLMENPAPLTLACEMVTDDPPVLVTVSDRFVLLPTCTLPNPSVVGFADNVPDVTPVPESEMFKLGLLPFEVMFTVPVAEPPVVGAKLTLNEVLWPAVRVRGRASPLMLKPVPLTEAAEIVKFDPPELVSVCVKLEFVLT
jgi:hypothetical protein